MPVGLESLGIEKLTVRERSELIEQIWDSLPDRINAEEVPAWHLAELARRRAEVKNSSATREDWRAVLKRIERFERLSVKSLMFLGSNDRTKGATEFGYPPAAACFSPGRSRE
jgi:putative addiction module component (TIGR02574 family)